MAHNERAQPERGHRSDTTSFRSLVEEKISVEEYVKRLDERVLDRRKNEETSRGSKARAKPQAR